jgi:hypothetical protein
MLCNDQRCALSDGNRIALDLGCQVDVFTVTILAWYTVIFFKRRVSRTYD